MTRGPRKHLDESALAIALDRLHAASFAHHDLPSALHDLAVASGAEGCFLIQNDASGFGCIGSPGIAEALDGFARGNWIDRNYRFERSPPFTDRGLLITERMLCTPAELDREPLQAEFLDRVGLRWWAGLRMAKEGNAALFLSIERSSRNEPFDGADYAALQRAMPHLRAAGATALAIGRAFECGTLDGLECVRRPAILLDGIARPIAMNTSAGAIFDDLFRLSEHRLAAACVGSDAALQRALGVVLKAGGGHLGPPPLPFRLRRMRGGSAWARLAPVAGPLAFSVKRPRVLLTVRTNGTDREAKAALLRTAYALTTAEIRVALALAEGVDLGAIADAQHVSIDTVRSHLKAVFAKTDTHRQMQVALLVNGLED